MKHTDIDGIRAQGSGSAKVVVVPPAWRTSKDPATSLDPYECTVPTVDASSSIPGTEPKRLIRKPYKMTLRPERSGSRFVAAQTQDGSPSIRLELFHDSVPSLKSLTVGFELLSGTTPAQLKALLDVMNERIVGTIVTPRDSSTR